MVSDCEEKGTEPNNGSTPSTASRIKPAAMENIFPTPVRKQRTTSVDSHHNDRETTMMSGSRGFGISSGTPQKHKSIEALKNQAIKAFSNKRSSSTDPETTWQRHEVTKKNSQYFEEAFAIRPPYNNVRDRVTKDSILAVELQLNFGMDREGKQRNFLADFLMTIGEIYQRPTNNVLISAVANAQIMLAGSTEPAYLLTISALAAEISPIKNQRTTTIIQNYLADALPVPVHRGVVRFCSMKEEDLAANGITVQQEIDKLEQQSANDKRSLGLRSRQSNRTSRKSTMLRSETPISALDISRSETPVLIDSLRSRAEGSNGRIDLTHSTGKMIKSRKNIMSFWKRNAS